MSTPERGGRNSGAGCDQRPSAAPGALHADAISAASTSLRAGGGAARLTAAASAPSSSVQLPASSLAPAATPGTTDAARVGPAALSLRTPAPGDGAEAGRGASATRPAPSHASASRVAGGAASSSPGAGASRTPAGAASVPGAGPPEPVGDDGAPLSAEAAASLFSPPASERHVAFLKFAHHKLKAGLQKRHMREADFCALAAEAGVPLVGDDSLIVAQLHVHEARALSNQAGQEAKHGPTGVSEAEALWRRSWVVLLAQALPVLQSRIDKGTLLPGKLRKVEEAYDVYEQQTIYQVKEQPMPGTAYLVQGSDTFGFGTALSAALAALILLELPLWRRDQRWRMEAFVLAALRLIPLTAGSRVRVASEVMLVDFFERYLTPSICGADFCASVLAVWHSRAAADVLRSRGSLQGGAEITAAFDADFEARKQADLAKRGLRRCGLPSCSKQEVTVLQFRVCGHCQSTRYCCPEHAKLHWRVHKREYETEKTERDEAGSGGGAAT